MTPQIKEAAEELYEKVAAVHLQHTAIDILASHIALAERRGGERVRDAVDQLKNCNSQAHQESKHAGDCDWCEGFRSAARKACEEAAKK